MYITMTTTSTPRILIATICLLALASAARAQMDAGFIGKRYAGLGFFSEDVRSSDIDNGDGVEFFANTPIIDWLDAGLRASYEKFSSYSLSDRRITGSVLAYTDLDWMKPFAELSVTATNQSSTVNSINYKNRETLWAVGLGAEIPFTRSSALFGSVTRNEYFNSQYDTYWTYKVGMNTWITPKLGATFAVTIWEGESTTYSVGVNVRF